MINIPKELRLKNLVESFRDWGRDCWCPSGKDNTCNKRYGFNLGELPDGYDHKFTYSHWGYNIKPLDLQAAIGLAQLEKLDTFINDRKRNWNYLRKGLDKLSSELYFSLPTHATKWDHENGFEWDNSGNKTECSWFGFMIGIRNGSKINKQHFANHLDTHKINNRMLFGGNLLRQPVAINEKVILGQLERKIIMIILDRSNYEFFTIYWNFSRIKKSSFRLHNINHHKICIRIFLINNF